MIGLVAFFDRVGNEFSTESVHIECFDRVTGVSAECINYLRCFARPSHYVFQPSRESLSVSTESLAIKNNITKSIQRCQTIATPLRSFYIITQILPAIIIIFATHTYRAPALCRQSSSIYVLLLTSYVTAAAGKYSHDYPYLAHVSVQTTPINKSPPGLYNMGTTHGRSNQWQWTRQQQ
jgi:hypothetical protein